MAKSSAKYTLLPDADKGDALLRAPDTPGDDSDEAGAEGKTASSAAGRERGEGSGTFPLPVDPRFDQTPPAAWKT
jgi:hypothetical protein